MPAAVDRSQAALTRVSWDESERQFVVEPIRPRR